MNKTKQIEQLEYENRRLKAAWRAFIANVEEMSIGVGLPTIFYVWKDGQQIAVTPDRAESFYKAIMTKWHKDEHSLIAMYERYERHNNALKKACQAAGDWLDKFCQSGRLPVDQESEAITLSDTLSSALDYAEEV